MKKTLVVLAAGLGQRYGGIKQLAPVGPSGEPLIDYGVYDALEAGFTKVVFIIKRDIEADFVRLIGRPAEKKAEVAYAFQDEAPLPAFYHKPAERVKMLGTVHAMLAAKELINEPFAIVNADDYYGKEAYRMIASELEGYDSMEPLACMAGYTLKNTVSEHGAVTRGVCAVEEGRLKKVTETYRILLQKDGSIVSLDEGARLDPESTVSMNFWGFSQGMLLLSEEYFSRFLKGLPDGDMKSEYPLPVMVDEMTREGKLRVRVIPCDSAWMGMTYPEDRMIVAAGIKALVAAGKYPLHIK